MKIRQINLYSIMTGLLCIACLTFIIFTSYQEKKFYKYFVFWFSIAIQFGCIFFFSGTYRTIHINKKGIQEKFWFITLQSINWDQVECIFKFTIPLEFYTALCISKIKFKKFDLDDYHDPKLAKQMLVFEYTEKTYSKFVKYMTENVPSKLYLLDDFNSLDWIKDEKEDANV